MPEPAPLQDQISFLSRVQEPLTHGDMGSEAIDPFLQQVRFYCKVHPEQGFPLDDVRRKVAEASFPKGHYRVQFKPLPLLREDQGREACLRLGLQVFGARRAFHAAQDLPHHLRAGRGQGFKITDTSFPEGLQNVSL